MMHTQLRPLFFWAFTPILKSLSLPLTPVLRYTVLFNETFHLLLSTFSTVLRINRCQMRRLLTNWKARAWSSGHCCVSAETCPNSPTVEWRLSQPITLNHISTWCRDLDVSNSNLPGTHWPDLTIVEGRLYVLKGLSLQKRSLLGIYVQPFACIVGDWSKAGTPLELIWEECCVSWWKCGW